MIRCCARLVLSIFILANGGWTLPFLGAGGAELQAQDARLPLPDQASQKNAEKLIRDLFKDEYSKKTPADKNALANRLLTQSEQSTNDPPTRYVLLREAQELALQSGDLPLTLKVVRALGQAFQVNAAALGFSALQVYGKSVRTPEDAKALALQLLQVVDQAVAAEDFDTSGKASEAAAQGARKLKDLALLSKCDAKAKEALARKAAFEAVVKARELLEKKADDPQANLVVGTYLCTVKNDWEAGLPHLAKAPEGPFRTQATLELSPPAEAGTQLSLADGWWDLSQKAADPSRLGLRQHAGVWYEKALPQLSGLGKTKAGNRLVQIRMDRLGPREAWVAIAAPAQEAVSGVLELTPKQGAAAGTDLSGLPSGDLDGISCRIRFQPGVPTQGGVTFEDKIKMAFVDFPALQLVFAHVVKAKWEMDFHNPCGDRSEYNLCVLVVDGEYVLYLDGEEACRVKTKMSRIVQAGFQVSHGPATFDQVRVRKK